MLKINYPLLDLLSQSTDSILYRNSTRWTSFTSTALGRSLAGAASEAAARTLINAARTDGANTFTGDQIAGSGYGFRSAFFTDPTQAYTYLAMGVDSTHATVLYNLTSSRTALTLQGASGQSRPLLELQDSLGAEKGSWMTAGIKLPTGGRIGYANNYGLTSNFTGINFGVTDTTIYGDSSAFFRVDGSTGSVIVAGHPSATAWQLAFTRDATVTGTKTAGLRSTATSELQVTDGSTGLGSLITGPLTVSQLSGGSGILTGWSNGTNIVSTVTASGAIRLGVGGTGTGGFQVYSSNIELMDCGYNVAGTKLSSFGSSSTVLTLNLASGQTAAAISVLDSLGASVGRWAADGYLSAKFLAGASPGSISIELQPNGVGLANTASIVFAPGGPYGSAGDVFSAANWRMGRISGDTATVYCQPYAATTAGLGLLGLIGQTAPLLKYALYSSTGATQVAADTYTWTNSTHATRTPLIVRTITDYNAERTYMTVSANGTAAGITLPTGTTLQALGGLYVTSGGNVTLDSGYNITGTRAYAYNSSSVPFSIQLASGQTANGIEQRTSLGAVNWLVDPSGNMALGTTTATIFSGYTTLTLNGSASGELEIKTNGTSRGFLFGESTGITLSAVGFLFLSATQGVKLPSMADGVAANSTLYYSTNASKLVYKDSGGTVNNLY